MGLAGELSQHLRDYGLKKTIKKIAYKSMHVDEKRYAAWRRQNCPGEEELKKQAQKTFDLMPLISIVVPVYMPDRAFLSKLIESVKAQSYSNWELCLSEGSGRDYRQPIENETSDYMGWLLETEASDSRIRIAYSDDRLNISHNTNNALKIARGEFVAFMDDDDIISPDALFECVRAINEKPGTDIIYSDEDKLSEDGRSFFEPHFKTEYNPELITSVNYFCHLVAARMALVRSVGMLDPKMDGAQDYDLVLKLLERTSNVCHIPKVLYHWRCHTGSTSENPDSKKYAFEAGRRAINEHYKRMGIAAHAINGELPGLYRTIHEFKDEPLLSVIIPNKDNPGVLKRCVESLLAKCKYEKLEILIMENNSTGSETFALYDELVRDPRIRVIVWKEEFNFSAINNEAVKYAAGEYLLFLNNDTEIIDEGSIEDMLGYCMRDGVGIVGARLYYPDMSIQHAGVILGFGGFAGHAFIGQPEAEPGYFARILEASNYSAVTAACMMVKRRAFEKVQGFDESFAVALNDVDFCLRMWRSGYRVVYDPYARLLHYESRTRGSDMEGSNKERFEGEIQNFQARWQEVLNAGDPFYSPNLSLVRCDFSVNA